MESVRVYPDAVEARLYWKLLKDLNDGVKVQLFVKLKESLLSKSNESVDTDSHAAYYTILDKLKTYQGYTKGWDGEDACPLTAKVTENFRQVLSIIDKHLLQGLTIYPETNGTLLIDSTKREAGISLGDEKFSYYEIANDKVTGENGIPFSVEALTNAIKHINR